MESFFHGRSSGLDPLNSYLSLPILIHSKNEIEPTGLPAQNPKGKGAVFLLDSGISGETAPMVSLFLENMKHESFSNMMRDEFITVTDFCVEDFLKGNIKSLFKNIKSLSSIVLKYFSPMIPSEFHELWKKGKMANLERKYEKSSERAIDNAVNLSLMRRHTVAHAWKVTVRKN